LEKDKKVIIIVIFITGLHKKPQGCGASVASAAGPFTTKEEKRTMWVEKMKGISTVSHEMYNNTLFQWWQLSSIL
jgi:hypothetical protein